MIAEFEMAAFVMRINKCADRSDSLKVFESEAFVWFL
jgi:hypothetical protein